ncbi:MAG: hypothetical protein M1325_01535, partial [Actinobacteria bacterium]|nr:hypothetical protein [Actinomycetota bacterium]
MDGDDEALRGKLEFAQGAAHGAISGFQVELHDTRARGVLHPESVQPVLLSVDPGKGAAVRAYDVAAPEEAEQPPGMFPLH